MIDKIKKIEDNSVIDLSNAKELEYWCIKFNITLKQLKKCINLMGPNLKDIKRYSKLVIKK